MERRFECPIDVRLEVVWAAGSLNGVGALRNLSRSGAWIDDVSTQPPMGATIRIIVLDMEEERDVVFVDGKVVRSTLSGFAVEFHPASSHKIGRFLDRLVESDSLG